jgi:hypothetical protein
MFYILSVVCVCDHQKIYNHVNTRVAKTLEEMLNHLKVVVTDESGDRNEKVRNDFVERVQRYTGEEIQNKQNNKQ